MFRIRRIYDDTLPLNRGLSIGSGLLLSEFLLASSDHLSYP